MSDLEARIAEVHIAHLGHVFFNVSGDNSRWSDKCVCGVELFGSENSPEHRMYPGVSYAESAHAAHVAAMLAPVIRKAQAEAWEQGNVAGSEDQQAWNGNWYEGGHVEHTNPHKEES